jgi:ribose-phosphate pyrophosphokinase
MSSNQLKIFSGSEHSNFTNLICNHLQVPVGNVYKHVFPSKERYAQFKENIRGCDVFLVSCNGQNANDSLMELFIMADAARRASAGRITTVIPYFPYSRADRKDKSRVPISAKLVLDLINAAGIDRVVTMDLHSPQVGGFTNLPFDHLTFEPVLSEYIRTKYHSLARRDSVVLMAPDVGAVKRVEKYADLLKSDFGFISKKRVSDTKVELQNVVGNVKDKHVVIIDDLTESLGTMVQAANECKKQGATKVTCAVTHGCLTDMGIKRLAENNSIDEFIHSNTTNTWGNIGFKPANVTELDVSMLFAKAIRSINKNESVSELFV